MVEEPELLPLLWKLELYIQDKEREWHILGGAERWRQGIGKPFYLNLWENLDTIDLIQSERFEHWERKAGRIQYEFRTRVLNKGRYLASYHYNSSGYNQGPFNKEFHRRQVIKEKLTGKEFGLELHFGDLVEVCGEVPHVVHAIARQRLGRRHHGQPGHVLQQLCSSLNKYND